jgi:hypothetical protein
LACLLQNHQLMYRVSLADSERWRGVSGELRAVFERHPHQQAELADRIGARVLFGDPAVTITQEIAAPLDAPAGAKGRASLAVELSRLALAA